MFSFSNKKIKKTGEDYGLKSACFDLLAGHNCPMANLCHSEVHVNSGGRRYIKDFGEFRCYATKAEVLFPRVYALRKKNLELTKLDNFVDTVSAGLVYFGIQLFRIHSSGDFYDFTYFRKWYKIAQLNPDVIFYGYSKQASFVKYLIDNPLPNFKLSYSMGGLMDNYAIKNNLPSCYVMTKENAHTMEHINLACTKEDYTNDLPLIMNGETFKIAFH